ncbi:MAG TPA: helix-turn-helix domain-containing protein [Solirubrobacterales bacterium]|nr:helix-turn-helix domain-containing protein [Solirubrobacterales bacterium]
MADSTATPDPAYLQGLRVALAAALDYGLAAIESPKRQVEPIPVELLSQARLAARNGVSLDVVLRRYAAGHVLLADALLEEAAAAGVATADLKDVLHTLAACFDRVFAAVGEEYGREERSRSADTSKQRRIQSVERLLAGESVGPEDLVYNLDGWHLGVVASGFGADGSLDEIAATFDRHLLAIDRGDGGVWAWFGGRRHFEQAELDLFVSFNLPEQTAIACGEPGQGLSGWRLTHHQATMALGVAQCGAEKPVRYDDVALLATVIQDDVLTAFLRQRYLVPLESDRDGGVAARQTLHAYFAVGGNVSSAAAALGVNRNTVASRLRTIESRLGRPLDSCGTDLEAALRMEQLSGLADEPLWAIS